MFICARIQIEKSERERMRRLLLCFICRNVRATLIVIADQAFRENKYEMISIHMVRFLLCICDAIALRLLFVVRWLHADLKISFD